MDHTLALALLAFGVALLYWLMRAEAARTDRLSQQKERERMKTLREQEQRGQWEREREAEKAEWNRRVEVKFGAVYVDGKLDLDKSVFL